MLRTRLIVGTLLTLAAGSILAADSFLAPIYPGFLGVTLVLAVLATRELVSLLPGAIRPNGLMCLGGVIAVLGVNWFQVSEVGSARLGLPPPADWGPVVLAFTGAVGAAALREIVTFSGSGGATGRMATAVWVIAYLGVLPSFLVKLRWLPGDTAAAALLLTIFVPKVGDIGAYFTGKLFGRTPFAPALSPKKTWEGFAGGMACAVATAIGLSSVAPIFRYGVIEAAAFGLCVGVAGVVGDLAESILKREAGAKDASASVPGFGGVLDVIDSVIFAAPVAYLFLAR